jgi:hypothetical protein
MDNKSLLQTASEACLLLNEAIRELIAPARIIELSKQWESVNPLPLNAIAAVRNMAVRSVIINVYRLKETRDSFLAGWLFSEEELQNLSFPPVEEFIGAAKWNDFQILRHQYAGHATSKESTSNQPGRIVTAPRLGKAIKETGMSDLEQFLKRIQKELLPGVENTRDELTRRYPTVEEFVNMTYPLDLEKAMQ